MTTEYIKEYPSGLILGTLDHTDQGDIIAKDFPSGLILGYYRKAINKTTDFSGYILNEGNTVVSLIYKFKNKQ